MNRYDPSTPRAALGLAAVAMAAITIAAMVVLPATLSSVGVGPDTLAAKAATKEPVEAGISPPRSDGAEVVDSREHHRPLIARLLGRKNSTGNVN